MKIKPLTISRLVIETARSEFEVEQMNFHNLEAIHLRIPKESDLFIDGKRIEHNGHLVYQFGAKS